MIQRFSAHIKRLAEERILAKHKGQEEYLTLVAKDLVYTPEQTDQLINDFFSTQYADVVKEEQPVFLSPATVLHYRMHRIEENDEEIQLKIKLIQQNQNMPLTHNTSSQNDEAESVSSCPEKTKKISPMLRRIRPKHRSKAS